MKKILVFLLLAFLGLSCLNAMTFANAVLQMDSMKTSDAVEAMYSGSGSLINQNVDYWWIPNVSKDEIVLLNIVPDDEWVWYKSWLCYSNLTELQYTWSRGTHFHDFVADKTDDYLVRIYASEGGFNYTINCDHPIQKEPMHVVRGNLSEGEVYNYWIPNVSKDEIVLLNIVPDDEWVWYKSWLCYSNLTELQYTWSRGTHFHDFVADKTDDYLLKIYASEGSFNYTIWHSARAVPTEITFSVEPNPVFVGQAVNLLGNLTTHEGIPISNEPVKILSNGTFITTLKTNATGWFKAKGKAGSAGTFNLTIRYEGSSQYLPCYASQELIVKKVQTWIYAIFIPNPVDVGDDCALRGILVDEFSNPIGSASVKLEYSKDNGLTWHPAGTLTTNSYGIFSKTFKAPSTGTYLVRIRYEGSSNHESSSAITALIVR